MTPPPSPESATRGENAATAGGAPVDPAPVLPPGGLVFGPYRLIERLGAGAMGVVWRAIDPRLGRAIALKQLHAASAAEGEARVRFLREARIAAGLRHPHIVPVHDVGEIDGVGFVAMDLIEGETWEAQLAREQGKAEPGRPTDPDRLRARVEILHAVADAVGCAHTQGMIHRDLKPGNVLIDARGRPYLADFGLARAFASDPAAAESAARITGTGVMVGTPSYMSPEQAEGRTGDLGPPCDVWALGVMLYQALAGRCPFDAPSVLDTLEAVRTLDPPSLRRHAPGSPADLEAVCLRALDKDPRHRYPSGGEFARDLARWLAHEPVAAALPGPLGRAQAWGRRRFRALAILGLALAALGAVAGWGLFERQRAASRHLDLLADIQQEAARLEDSLMRTPLPEAGKRQAAEQIFGLLDRSVSEDATDGATLAWRGRVREMLGDVAGAEADYASAGKRSPHSAAAWLLPGLSRLERYFALRRPRSWRWEVGRTRLTPAPPESPAEVDLRTRGLRDLDAAERLGGGDDGEASAELRLAGRALAALAGAEPGGPDRAIALLAGLPGPRAGRLRGLAHFYSARFGLAVAEFDAVLAEWTQDAPARYWRAETLLALAGERQVAGEDPDPELQRAIADLDPLVAGDQPLRALALRAIVRSVQGTEASNGGRDSIAPLRGAYADLTAVLEGAPDSPAILAHRGNIADLLAQAAVVRSEDPMPWHDLALADFDRAVALAPEDAKCRMARSANYQSRAESRRGSPEALSWLESALADADEAVRLEPDQFLYRCQRAALLQIIAEVGMPGRDPRPDIERGLADLDHALALEPDSALVHDGVGRLLALRAVYVLQSGGDPASDGAAALRSFDHALHLDPRSANVYGNRGLTRLVFAQFRLASGEDVRVDLAAAAADGEAAVREKPGLQRGWTVLARAAARLADSEARWRGDPSRAAGPALDRLERAADAGLLNPGNRLDTARLAAELARAEALAGRDSLPRWRSAVARLDALLAAVPGWTDALALRGVTLLRLAWHEQRSGLDSAEHLSAAEADLAAAGRAGDGNSLANLAILLRGEGRLAEAVALLDRIVRGSPRAAPVLGPILISTRALAARAAEPWAGAYLRAHRAEDAGDGAGALALFEEALAGCGSAADAAPELRDALANALYNAASIGARQRVARGDDPARDAAERDRVFQRLGAALEAGFGPWQRVEADPDLAVVRADPRFAALRERYRPR